MISDLKIYDKSVPGNVQILKPQTQLLVNGRHDRTRYKINLHVAKVITIYMEKLHFDNKMKSGKTLDTLIKLTSSNNKHASAMVAMQMVRTYLWVTIRLGVNAEVTERAYAIMDKGLNDLAC